MEKQKIMILGGSSVGKTSLRIVFREGFFIEPSKYDPVTESTCSNRKMVDDQETIVDVWDIGAGINPFNAKLMKDLCVKGSEGFILVYSITSKESFNELRNIYNEIQLIKDNCYENNENNDEIREKVKIPIVIVGNKKDLETGREVSEEEGKELAKEFNCPFIEVSSMDVPLANESLFLAIREIRKFPLSPPPLNPPHNSKCFIM